MGNLIGIRTENITAAAVTTISNVTLATITGLTQAVAANTTWWMRFIIPFSVGATGGIRLQVVVPAAPTLFVHSYKLFQFGTPGTLLDANVQVASAAITNAAAGAGTNYFESTLYFKNGVNAGNVSLQFAQNTSVAATLTILQGSIMEIYQM